MLPPLSLLRFFSVSLWNTSDLFCFKIISSWLITILFPMIFFKHLQHVQTSRTRILSAAKSPQHVHYFCAESTSLILPCCSREPLNLFAFICGFAQLHSFINVKTHFSYFLKCAYKSSAGNHLQTVWLFLAPYACYLL